MVFAVCSHLVAACDLFSIELRGWKKVKVFVYRARRGRKPQALTFSEKAISANPMPLRATQTIEDQRQNLFLIDGNNAPSHPIINADFAAKAIPSETAASTSNTRSYKRKTPALEPSASQASELILVQDKRRPGRPKKNTSAPEPSSNQVTEPILVQEKRKPEIEYIKDVQLEHMSVFLFIWRN